MILDLKSVKQSINISRIAAYNLSFLPFVIVISTNMLSKIILVGYSQSKQYY